MQETKEINKVVYLSNNDILPNRFQPRKYFDEEEIMQLSESIKEHGVINPIIVRKLGDKYELVAGERRYKANILAGNDNIPAIIMDVNDKESSEIAVVENIQRKDLNAIEEAISYKRILDIGYMTQDQLAQKMGKSQSAIANKIRLLKLSDEVQDALMKKQISERHARSLLKIGSHKKQNELLERIVNERLTVRKTDEEIEKMNNNIYNNNPDSLAPIMPESNVLNNNKPEASINVDSNVNQNIGEQNNVINPIMPDFSNTQPIPNQSIPTSIEQPTEPQIQIPEPTTTQNIPTLSIDDVLAKANQPSVVGMPGVNNQEQPIQPTNNITENINVGMPDLGSINETPTPIESNSLEMPQLNPINEIEEVEKFDNTLTSSNDNGFTMPEINSINNNFDLPQANNAPLASDIPHSNDIPETFNFNVNNDSNININNSPIDTAPIIDTTMNVEGSNQNMSGVDSGVFNNNNTFSNESQFEKIPEPIIVNDYNEQHDPIMPEQINKQPTIDFKEIINLIRKCSQAIENSGYKIETEEYNLDNLYQVVFKIDKN